MKIRTALFFILIFCCSCATSGTGNNIQKSKAHYQLGISYLNDNNIQPAFVEFQKAIELNPNDKNSHNALGIIHLQKLENFDKAIDHFKTAINIDSNFSEAANNLGNAYAKIDKYEEAIESYKKAISNPLYKKTAIVLNNLGMVYYRLDRFDDSADTFKEALKRISDFPLPYYGLALSYNAKGRYGDASTAIARAIELDPLYNGDREKAVKDLKERKIRARGDEEKDIIDYLEILKY